MFVFILFFIAYSLTAFLVQNLWVLLGFTMFNILLMICFKISILKILKSFNRAFWFALFVFLFNLIFDSVLNSLVIAWRILIVFNFSFIFSKAMPPAKMAVAFGQLFLPLKIFKVNTKNLSLMFVIIFNFIEIFSEDLKTLKNSLKARNFRFTPMNLIKQGHVILLMFFANLFKRVDSLEASLIARGYEN